jgi:hypothetical protein
MVGIVEVVLVRVVVLVITVGYITTSKQFNMLKQQIEEVKILTHLDLS